VDSLNELGFYTLAGAPSSPRVLIDEVQAAERLGIGSVFISERFNIKEAATLSGAVGAISQGLGIATAATNQNTRHPIVTASFATTMHRLTGGRFTLGLGRGIDMVFDMLGLPRIKTAEMEDVAGLMRRLWRGEMIFGHDGPAGKFGMLSLDPTFDEAIPLLLTAFAPRSLRLAGRAFDAVVLHTLRIGGPSWRIDITTLYRTRRCPAPRDRGGSQRRALSARKGGRGPGQLVSPAPGASVGRT